MSEIETSRDFIEIADKFAADAVADTERRAHCHWIRLAASRYLKDRVRAEDVRTPFYFDPFYAQEACQFIEGLPHVEGKWETETIVLHKSHVFFLVNLFGFRSSDGTRRFTAALFAVARKNAKSTLAAAIMLYCLCCEDEPGTQVITAATTGDQARIIFNIAKRMVEKAHDLRESFNLQPFVHAIVNWNVGGNMKPINAHASTQDGLNPSHTCLDEIHAHKTHDLLNVLQSAAGARNNALWLYTTTEGYETPGPWPEMRKFSHQILSGIIDADHFLALIFALDDQIGEEGKPGYTPEDGDFDETKWVKANPLMEVNPILEREIRKAAIDAKQMPGRHAEFKIKRLNRQSAAAKTWLNIERWKRCGGDVDLNKMEGHPCCAGLDGAATTDIMAFRLVWLIDGVVYTWGRRWAPSEAVESRTQRKTVPYASWAQSGLITVLPGHTLDYMRIQKDITELIDRFAPKRVAYDAWNLRDLIGRLNNEFPARQVTPTKSISIFQEFRQGAKSFHPAMIATEKYYLEGKLRHGGDPVLNWCASNVVPRYDENMNIAPDRKRSADKIDDAVALFMAVGAMAQEEPEKPAFQLIFV